MSEIEDILKEGIAAVRAGQNAKGRALLREVIRHRPNDANVWLWMSGAVETHDERLMCLRRALEVDPNNTHARKAIQTLETGTIETKVAPQQAVDATSQPVKTEHPLRTASASTETGKKGRKRLPIVLAFVCAFLCIIVTASLIAYYYQQKYPSDSYIVGQWQLEQFDVDAVWVLWVFRSDGRWVVVRGGHAISEGTWELWHPKSLVVRQGSSHTTFEISHHDPLVFPHIKMILADESGDEVVLWKDKDCKEWDCYSYWMTEY